MKKFSVLLCAFAGLLFSACGGGEEGWKRVDGVIVFDTPCLLYTSDAADD